METNEINTQAVNEAKTVQGAKNNAFIKLFSSISTAVFILVFIAIASVIGTLIPQGQRFAFYKENFPSYVKWIYLFSFNDLYHSIWFVALVILLCLNIAVCTWRRFKAHLKNVKNVHVIVSGEFITNQRFNKIVNSRVISEDLPAVIEREIKSAGYACSHEEKDGKHYFFGNYGAYSFIGEFLVHISILLVLAGALIGNVFGYKMPSYLWKTGEIIKVMPKQYEDLSDKMNELRERSQDDQIDRHVELGELMMKREQIKSKPVLTMRLDAFKTVYVEQKPSETAETFVKNWYSTLTVLDDSTPVLTKTISVNDPLHFNGIDVYQSSYDRRAVYNVFKIKYFEGDSTAESRMLTITGIGKSAAIPGTKMSVTVKRFEPDFKIDMATHEYFSESTEPLNPAVQIAIDTPETKEAKISWLFKNMPEFSHDGKFSVDIKGRFEFADLGMDYEDYSGLQITHDPGVDLVWAGSAVMILGFFWAFYIYHKRLWILVDKTGGRIVMGASASKNHYAFEEEFKEISAKIESEVKK